ncbi:nitrate- and nitrite sensing domain-containing protein [Micromonospora sp. NPDC050200]|uniref:sensor histidine kinase n=1 Tax=Micromonospora sp. NPDC050200 TaxID=3155664 RepID=UPI0033F5B9CF
MTLWLVASGYLVLQGFINREVAKGVRQVSIPAVPALASVQQERRLSIAYLARPATGIQGLLNQRQQTDEGLSEMRAAADSALANAPESIATSWKTFTEYLNQLPSVRSRIDSRTTDREAAYDFYNNLLDSATSLFDTQARIVPDVTAAQGGITATEAFRVSDLMSRTGSIIDGAFALGGLKQQDYLEFANLVGAYHASLTNIAPNLHPDARKRYEDLTGSTHWKDLIAAENTLIAGGTWRDGPPRGVRIDRTRWEALTRQVSADLVDLTIQQADKVSAQTLRTGNNQLWTATLGSLLALLIAVTAIVWAIRQSQVLVDRALSVRLAQLGKDATAVVDQQLPALMERLRRREKVDATVDLPMQDYGSDEIGQVADVIRRSLQAAAGAAIDEAKTRAAGVAMLMGVARRPQRPLQHGLRVIEDLQDRVGDEQLLTQLFDINHQLSQTRRFLENLIILAGGQIGRRFQNPVPMRRVLLAAFGEAQHYQRITLRKAPDVALVGQAVAGTVHLLAELLDNALAFSPPGSTVWVTCNEAKHGIAVEIEDAGVGMASDALEGANELLATAPAPDVTALKDGAQVGLHVVAELAKRDGIQVSLRTSAYGGLLAIVLLPDRLVIAEPSTDGTETAQQPALATTVTRNGDQRKTETATMPAAGVAVVSRGSVQAPPSSAGKQDRRHDRAGGTVRNHQQNTSAGTLRQPETSVPGVTGTGAAGPRAGARPALPLRQPQEHLAPGLRDDDSVHDEAGKAARPAQRPEDARERFARYQRSWAAGQAASDDQPKTRDEQGGKA